jgi:serine/threonine-protein kinase
MPSEPSFFRPSSFIPHPSDSRVQQLVDEILGERTPEEVCADCPELLPEVRKRWEQMRLVEAQLEALFPTPAPSGQADTPGRSDLSAELPHIPGYEVEGLLGRGGMGIVYKARQLGLNRPVALKMLLAGAYAGLEERERFLREAETVAGLRHANVVQVHDIGDQYGQPYFAMEYIEGGSLAQKLRGTPQPVRQAAALVSTLAEAVQAAHRAGIIHRDLKPANVLLQGKSEIPDPRSPLRDARFDNALPPPRSDSEFRISDFDPKIADFGLARHFDTGSGLTLSGARIGTPSYMAPEQALGTTRTIGPAVDIYSLGAVLYELLTGRPPFKGETSAETELQVIYQDPVPPSRLNPRVPRDLETICLKCLRKEPERRYSTAAALADDLRRFQRGEPIAARPAGLPERLGKWVRRRPTAAALLGAAVLFAIALIAGAQWLAVQRAQRRYILDADLREVADLQQQARWSEAQVALQRAQARLNGSSDSDLRQRVDQARKELDLVVELDRIRLNRLTCGNLDFYKASADRDYARAFTDSDLGKVQDDPADFVAARVRASAIRVALTAALDDWAVCAADKDQRDWLLAVARQADPDPEGWRDRIRDPASWEDPAALAALARTVPVRKQSVPLLMGLGERLGAAGGDLPAFLKRVHREHPADFWANLILGDALLKTAPRQAEGFYRAALASRPGAAVGYTALGDALYGQALREEASGFYRWAIEIDPQYARGQTNLGNILKDMGQRDKAIACYHRALEADPDYAWAHFDLANALTDAGRLDEALEHYRLFHAIGPTIPHVVNILRSDMVRRGRGEEVRREWKKKLEQDPPEHDAWFGYAELCLFLEDQGEYRRARQDLLGRFGDTKDASIAEKTARAVLLMPASEEELRTATALADRAVAAKSTTLEWVYPYYLFVKGLAEYRQGHFESAISIMKSRAGAVMGPCPRFLIAMGSYRLGQEPEARTILAAAISAYEWSMAEVRSHDQWLWHVFRREAETLIFPNTAAFLQGKYTPRDNTERLALVGVCRFKNRTCAAAQLYADAFTADARLAGDSQFNHRYNAARSAALAGCGLGEDASGLGEAQRKHWHGQALQWLRAELAARSRALDADTTAARSGVCEELTRWQKEPDLACVRDPDQLDKLAADERKEYQAIWEQVAAVLVRTRK